MTVRIALLGLGEAGSAIASDLVAAGADVCGYDPKTQPPPGVTPRSSEADAVRDADLVLSVNSGHDALTALTNALPALQVRTLWADLNTASPARKTELAAVAGDVPVVDVAIMAPVPGTGLATPMLASGPAARQCADQLNRFGARVDLLQGPVGAASSRKLLRSVFYKGLAAAVIEALDAARAAGCHQWLQQHIRDEFVAFDETTIERLVTGSHAHARRRTDEMTAATEQLIELGITPHIAPATRDLLAELAGSPPTPGATGSADE